MRLLLTVLAFCSLAMIGLGIHYQLWGLAAVGGLIWWDMGRRGSKEK